MNPYTPPSVSDRPSFSATQEAEETLPLGRPCPSCKSANTTQGEVWKSRPNILFVICFGWVFLLVRTAFVRHREVCRDCSAIHYYRNAGNNIALAVLLFVVLLMVIGFMED